MAASVGSHRSRMVTPPLSAASLSPLCPVELTPDEIANIVGRVLGRHITCRSMLIEKWVELCINNME